jgi:hypothetical protein
MKLLKIDALVMECAEMVIDVVSMRRKVCKKENSTFVFKKNMMKN